MKFNPSVKHLQVLNAMSEIGKRNAKACVDTLGYYGAINFMIEQSNGKVDEEMAVIIADIALHLLPSVYQVLNLN